MSARIIPCHACGALPLPRKLGRPSKVDPETRAYILSVSQGAGWTYAAIARALNLLEVPTPSGAAKWSRSSVRYIANEAKP